MSLRKSGEQASTAPATNVKAGSDTPSAEAVQDKVETPATPVEEAPASVETPPAATEEVQAEEPAAEEEEKAVLDPSMGKFRARVLKIRDPHSGVMYSTRHATLAERTDWVLSQLGAKVLIEEK